MYKVSFFAPESAALAVKNAMFKAGAGRIGNYEQCSFETKGIGQFKAMAGADPFIGTVGELEKVTELKVEMVCADERILDVIRALKENHPYEMPAYDIIKLADF
ncbi:MAG: NGG1p interacting factor NIF3 [Bacteriovorax sp.]